MKPINPCRRGHCAGLYTTMSTLIVHISLTGLAQTLNKDTKNSPFLQLSPAPKGQRKGHKEISLIHRHPGGTSAWDRTGPSISLAPMLGLADGMCAPPSLQVNNTVAFEALPSDPHITVSLQPAGCTNKSRGREASLLFSLSDVDHGDPVVTRGWLTTMILW